MKHIAIYPGTFDPISFGHLDLVQRSCGIFDEIVLAIAVAAPKQTLFDIEERLALTREVVAPLDNVTVEPFDGLLMHYVQQKNVRTLIRGLRAFSDFEYEFQMALINRKLAPDVETLFMMPNETYSYLSSTRIKEVAALGGDVSRFVPESVEVALRNKFATS